MIIMCQIILTDFSTDPLFLKDYPNNFDASQGSSSFNNGMLGVGVKSS